MTFERLLGSKLEDLSKSSKSILLLGPRQTGKSTLIEGILNKSAKESLIYRLQNLEVFQRVIKSPEQIAKNVEAKLEKKKAINLYIDEVQKCPILLDDCQYLIDKYKTRISVILTGSSARKLRQRGVNLLPGRVFVQYLHSLTFPEIMPIDEQNIVPIKTKITKYPKDKPSLEDLLIYGSLPGILNEKKYKGDLLNSYVSTYLQEEIKAEALTRNLGAFSRFLELSASESGLTPNLSRLSQESGIPLMTIKNYFQLLEDTLITFSIPAFTKSSRKQILSASKYVYFDLGVRNAASEIPLNSKILKTEIGGKLFEQFICLELIKRIEYQYPHWKYFYWRTNNGLEVDFIIQTEDEIIPIEIKFTDTPQKNHIKHLEIFMEEYKAKRGFLVGTFPRAQKLSERIYAIPWNEI